MISRALDAACPPGMKQTFRQDTNDVAVRVGDDRVARDDHESASQQAGDLVYDALQGCKPEREDDGIGVRQRVTVLGALVASACTAGWELFICRTERLTPYGTGAAGSSDGGGAEDGGAD